MANFLDAAINTAFPGWGAKRMRARAEISALSSFVAASDSQRSMMGWNPQPKSADGDIGTGLKKMRARSRHMYANDALPAGAIDTTLLSAVGSGLKLQPKPDWKRAGIGSEEEANSWKGLVESEFRLWAESPDCDITRTQNLYGLQALALCGVLASGDIFPLLTKADRPGPYSLAVQMIEADLVANPQGIPSGVKIFDGVETDAFGAPVAYHVFNSHPSELASRNQNPRRIEAFSKDGARRQMLHMFDRKRPGQTRGIPWFAPVMERLKQLGSYTESEMMAAVVNSFLTIFVKTANGQGLAPIPGQPAAENSGDNYKLGHGSIIQLSPDQDIVSAGVNRPNPAFDPFVLAILRQVGSGLGVPHEVIVKHFTSSYSAARAALLEAWRFFRNRRAFVADTLCRPVYEAWMWEAVARQRIPAPGFFDDPAVRAAYLQSEWIGDSPGQINPMDEAQAAGERLKIGISTLEDETMAATGRVYEDVHEQQKKERDMRKRDGLPVFEPAPESGKPAPPADPNMPDRQKEEKDAA